MPSSDAEAQPSQSVRTISDDDFNEFEVLIESVLHVRNLVLRDLKDNAARALFEISQRMRHIALHMNGVTE